MRPITNPPFSSTSSRLEAADLDAPGAYGTLRAIERAAAARAIVSRREILASLSPRRSARSIVATLRALCAQGLLVRTWGPHRTALYWPTTLGIAGGAPAPGEPRPADPEPTPLESSGLENASTDRPAASKTRPLGPGPYNTEYYSQKKKKKGIGKGKREKAPSGKEGTDPTGGRPTPDPPPAEQAAVAALVRLWTEARRRAFGLPTCRPLLDVAARPWASADPRLRRRWRAFARLAVRLPEWGADPAEFVAAVMGHFRTWSRGPGFRVPNPAQVGGPWGRGIWERWHRARLAEGGGRPDWLRQVTAQATAPRAERLQAELRTAYAACRAEGVDWAISLTWSPEVLQTLQDCEPAARPVIRELLRDLPGDGPAAAEQRAAARAGLCRAGRLVGARIKARRLWREVTGGHKLPLARQPAEAVGDPLPPPVSMREWRQEAARVGLDLRTDGDDLREMIARRRARRREDAWQGWLR